MEGQLRGKRIAILVASRVEQGDLSEPRKLFEQAGAQTFIVCPAEEASSWEAARWNARFPVDATLDQISADDFDALLLPSHPHSYETLRANPKAVRFVEQFFEAGKPVEAICHLSARPDVVGRTLARSRLESDLWMLEAENARGSDWRASGSNGTARLLDLGDAPPFGRMMLNDWGGGPKTRH